VLLRLLLSALLLRLRLGALLRLLLGVLLLRLLLGTLRLRLRLLLRLLFPVLLRLWLAVGRHAHSHKQHRADYSRRHPVQNIDIHGTPP
jgi:hypothetical protein